MRSLDGNNRPSISGAVGATESGPAEAGLAEAVASLRSKSVRSAAVERIRWTAEADRIVQGLPQPLQLGHGLYHVLERISLPVLSHDVLLGRTPEQVLGTRQEAELERLTAAWKRPTPAWMPDSGHECFAWHRLLDLGLPGLEGYARTELARREAEGAPESMLTFLRGAIRVYEAFRMYARRYGMAARDAGLSGPAAVCETLAEAPPHTFPEALQLVWLVGHVFCTVVSANSALTFGRLDDMLLPFFREDCRTGGLTPDRGRYLVRDLYCKMNLILGRGEHQMGQRNTGWLRNPAYDTTPYIVLGGRRIDNSPTTNELSELLLDCVDPRLKNPIVVIRYTPDVAPAFWRLACRKMRDNATVMVYNDDRVIPALVSSGIDVSDAVTYTMHGCNWPDVPGIQRRCRMHSGELPRYVLEALADPMPPSMDELYERISAAFRQELLPHCDRLRSDLRHRKAAPTGRLHVDDCFLDGPVARARSWLDGGVKYPTLTCALQYVATCADCLAAVERLMLDSAPPALEDLREALVRDFAGNEALRQQCLAAPKFGCDDDRADRHAVRILNRLSDDIDQVSRLGSDDAVVVLRCLTTDMRHRTFGRACGATPDGRLAGEPVSENSSPYPGSSTKGLTAQLRSLAKLPFHRICSGPLNLRLRRDAFDGERGVAQLESLLTAYFGMGGLQVQLSLAGTNVLRNAQKHPEQHRDLIVRITGYSALFTDMTTEAQEEIIRREEMA